MFSEFSLSDSENTNINSFLKDAVYESQWRTVGEILHQSALSQTLRTWVIRKACEQAGEDDLIEHIIPRLETEDELEAVYRRDQLARRRQLKHESLMSPYITSSEQAEALSVCWRQVPSSKTMLIALFQRGVQLSKMNWVVRTMNNAPGDLKECIMSCFSNEHLNHLFTVSVNEHLWRVVIVLLRHEVIDDTLCRWAIDESYRSVCGVPLTDYTLPACRDHQRRDFELTVAVRRGKWKDVGQLLKRGVHAALGRWAVTEGSGRADDGAFVQYILPWCAEDQLVPLLVQAVRREQSGADHTRRMCAITQASQFVKEEAVIQHIIPHLHTEGELEAVFSSITWNLEISRLVGKLLQRGLDLSLFVWVVGALNRVCVYCTDEFLEKYLVPVCSADQLLSLFMLSVRERQWRTVASFLRHGMGDEQRRWAVEEALQHATLENDEDTSGVIAYWSDGQLGVVFEEAVRRHLWRTVRKLLDRPVDGDLVRQAIEESCKSVCGEPLADYTLPACRDDQRHDFEFTDAVRRGEWKDVGRLLQCGVEDNLCRWAVTQFSSRADEHDIVKYILPHSADDQLDSLLTKAATRKQWRAVGFFLQRDGDDTLHRWVILEDGKHSDACIIVYCIRPLWSNVPSDVINSPQHTGDARPAAEAREGADGFWWEPPEPPGLTVDQLHLMLDEAVRRGLWEVSSQCPQTERHAGRDCSHTAVHLHGHGLEQFLQRMVTHKFNVLSFCVFGVSSERKLTRVITEIPDDESWEQSFLDIVCLSVAAMTPFPMGDTDFFKLINFSEACHLHSLAIVYLDVLHFVMCPELDRARNHATKNLQTVVSGWEQQLAELYVNTKYSTDTELALVYLFFCLCFSLDISEESSDLLCVVLSTIPLLPSLQSAAVRVMLHAKRWDVINNAVLCHVWEDVRRSVLRAAVEQREWTTVRHMADHSLYDDERNWALMQAYYEDRWDVVLALADFGHNADQRKRIYRQVAKHGDGETILELFKRGADVRTVREQLETASPSRERPLRQETVARYQNKLSWLAWLEGKIEDTADNLQGAIQRNKWRAVLHRVRCEPSTLSLALDAAIEKEAWHVVVQLARLGMDAAQRDSLFPEVIKRRQWAVGRALLEGGYFDGGEHGVSVELRRVALPQLLNVGQWILVARVMEHGMDDEERRRVMWEALDRREGSVVAHIISIMEGRVCVEERERVFQQAIRQGVWQALKRLVEEKDSAGITHRDLTLPAAAKHHQWDILTHCLQHGADVDKRDAAGDTMLHRAAREGDWEGVQGLLLHGVANQHLLDSRGYSVLHIAVKDGWDADWAAVKMLVEFQCDVNQPDPHDVTPLQRMIKDNAGEIIKLAMFWGRNVGQTVTEEGKTPLHALCEAGVLDNMHIAVARGGDPLAVTEYGDTVLSLSVKNEECPQELLAECIQLGVSTHQPRITDHLMKWTGRRLHGYSLEFYDASTMYHAILQCNKAITEMLYESGSCSNTELHNIAQRWFVPNNYPGEQRAVYTYDKYAPLPYIPNDQVAYVSAIVNTPRRLESMCRLVISHHIGVCKPRRRRLPTWFSHLHDYILFTDLTGPGSGRVRPRRSLRTNNPPSRYTFHLATIQDKMAVYFSLAVYNYGGRWQLSHCQQL